jgi:hypothetical protein
VTKSSPLLVAIFDRLFPSWASKTKLASWPICGNVRRLFVLPVSYSRNAASAVRRDGFWGYRPKSSIKGEVKKKHDGIGESFSYVPAHAIEQDMF